jgi:hypothetical protein
MKLKVPEVIILLCHTHTMQNSPRICMSFSYIESWDVSYRVSNSARTRTKLRRKSVVMTKTIQPYLSSIIPRENVLKIQCDQFLLTYFSSILPCEHVVIIQYDQFLLTYFSPVLPWEHVVKIQYDYFFLTYFSSILPCEQVLKYIITTSYSPFSFNFSYYMQVYGISVSKFWSHYCRWARIVAISLKGHKTVTTVCYKSPRY